jgi:hypothetical protein
MASVSQGANMPQEQDDDYVSKLLFGYSKSPIIPKDIALLVSAAAIKNTYGEEELTRQGVLSVESQGDNWIILGNPTNFDVRLVHGVVYGPVRVLISKSNCQILLMEITASFDSKNDQK